MVITIAVGALFFVISYWTNREFRVLQTTTEQYILCEKAATNLRDGSDYLTEQVRLYVMTGQQTYLDSYFEEAEHDALTDLLNLGSFEKLLNIYEKGDAPYALIIVDVDYFKSVNDTCGHSAGDATLKKISSLLYAAFLSLFLGVEYQDGTLRNKIIAGHARWKVYAASLLSGAAGCWVVLLGWLLSIPIGVLKFGWFTAPAAGLALELAVALGIAAAIAAILTLLGMLLPNRAVAAVLAILLVLGLLLLGSVLYNALWEPEYLTGMVMTANGIEMGEAQPNPNYISGALRTVFQFLVDTLPTGQSILLANQELGRPGLSLAASGAIVLLCSGCGVATFRRKDLK